MIGGVLGRSRHAGAGTDAALARSTAVVLDAVRRATVAAHERGERLALVAVSWDNALDVAEAWGSAMGRRSADDLARRAEQAGPAVEVLHRSHLGGMLLAVGAPDEGGLRHEVDRVGAAMRRPMSLGDLRVQPVVTLGARLADLDVGAHVLLRDVRTTVAHARRLTPGSGRWFDPGLRPVRARALALAADLADALSAWAEGPPDRRAQTPDDVRVAFQPIRELATKRVVAAEGLLRWHHPAHGEQPAGPTVALAERHGLAPALGRAVLDRSLAAAARWPDDVVVHVNVAAAELREPGFVDGVRALLWRHRVPTHRLLLELTEGAVLTGPDTVVPVLHELAGLGVGLGIDDFGTGYSSIALLRELPLDVVKIDRSLTQGVAASTEEYDLARSVLALLATTGARVVAEGVETAAQAAHLRALGCVLGQGWHLGRPGDAALIGSPRGGV